MKKILLCIITVALVSALLIVASGDEVTWNGETECLGELLMVVDVTNPFAYVGMVDYVFVGTVEGRDAVIPDRRTEYEQSFSKYSIHVDKNLKGELAEDIVCAKMGGLKKDGTMLLVAAETPSGELIPDSGLPEIGKQYVFLAYAQPDGSLTLSEIFDNREYDTRLLEEYTDYVENEIPYDRERFVSEYDALR
ncbi:MAG: hypothetical protein IJO35_01445 [Methanocorpusculum sp.]|nr:hypothetical protein [Methanocorpusculum sp.]